MNEEFESTWKERKLPMFAFCFPEDTKENRKT